MPAYHARAAFRSTETGTGRVIVNVLHFEVDTLTSPPNWTSIAGDIDAWLRTAYKAMLASSYTLNDLTVTDENYPGSTHGQGFFGIGEAGTRAIGDSKEPAAFCGVISFSTAVAKRYARGHMFGPPAVASTSLAPGGILDVANAYYVALNAFGALAKAGHTAGSTSYVLEVFSRTKVALNQTPFAFPVTAARVAVTPHWLDSRMSIP